MAIVSEGGFPVGIQEGGQAQASLYGFSNEIVAHILGTLVSGDNTIGAAVTNVHYVLLNYHMIAGGTIDADIRGGSLTMTGTLSMPPRDMVSVPFSGTALASTAENTPLVLHVNGAVTMGGHLRYNKVTLKKNIFVT